VSLADWANVAAILGPVLVLLAACAGVARYIFGRIKHNREVEKAKRESRRSDILNWMSTTQGALANYDRLLAGGISGQERSNHGDIIGKARAALLAAGDPELTKIAEEILTPYLVEQDDGSEVAKKYGDFRNRNRTGLSMAVQRFAILLKEAS